MILLTEMLNNAAVIASVQMALALLLDHWLGEFRRWHPLAGFGVLASFLERRFNPPTVLPLTGLTRFTTRVRGGACWLILVVPIPLLLLSVPANSIYAWLVNIGAVYFAVGLNSLCKHAQQIDIALQKHHLHQARQFTGLIVSRDTKSLSPQQMSRATVESVLENGHDGVIATLLYFAIGGAPLVILHRLANTLDAMWGYKTQRFHYFGWCAARMDDVLGYLGSYCSALLYAIQVKPPRAIGRLLLISWRQSRHYKSKNGGLCMATGAAVLGCTLGGTSTYAGKLQQSPVLGSGQAVSPEHIQKAVTLVQRSAWIGVLLVFTGGLIWPF